MDKNNEILRSLLALHATFAVLFVIYMTILIGLSAVVLNEVSAINKCLAVSEGQFGTCYRSAK